MKPLLSHTLCDGVGQSRQLNVVSANAAHDHAPSGQVSTIAPSTARNHGARRAATLPRRASPSQKLEKPTMGPFRCSLSAHLIDCGDKTATQASCLT